MTSFYSQYPLFQFVETLSAMLLFTVMVVVLATFFYLVLHSKKAGQTAEADYELTAW